MMMDFYNRTSMILNENSIEFDPKVLVPFINHHFPDMRRTLNELQRYSMGGKIDEGILTSIDSTHFKTLIGYLKDKDFKNMRLWVGEQSMDATSLYTKLYDTAYDFVQPGSIPALVMIIAEYQYKNSFVANTEINMAACFTEIMSAVDFI